MPLTIKNTPYGQLRYTESGKLYEIIATQYELHRWAWRPNNHWPCSTLADLSDSHDPHSNLTTAALIVTLDPYDGNLIDLETPNDPHEDGAQPWIDGDELIAYIDDMTKGI